VAFEAYKNNEIDIIELARRPGHRHGRPSLEPGSQVYPGSCTYAFMFHQLKEPFTDKAVPKLLLTPWIAMPGSPMCSRSGRFHLDLDPLASPVSGSETRYAYDPEMAKQTLTDAATRLRMASWLARMAPHRYHATFSDTPRNRTRNEWLVAKYKEVGY